MNSSLKTAFLAGVIGATIGALAMYASQKGNSNRQKTEATPLYWVAPMDPNYRRDKPGKSPMGMDLIPVYQQSEKGEAPGTVRISPELVNNLGVRTGLVEQRALNTEIHTVGYVQYDENRLIHIHPRISGWVEKLYVKASGDPVKKGSPIYSLYSPELVNAQEELVLALKRGNVELVRATEERLNALQFEKTLVAKLKKSRQVQQTVTFFAPQTGVVEHLEIREGYYVEPGTTLFSIGALDKVWVEAEVFERQAAQVQAGDTVSMSLEFLPGREWPGRVDYIYPTLNKPTRTLRLRLSFDNPAGELKPNMFAKVVIHSSGDNTLVVPREAVIRTGQQDRVVLAKGEGRFKSVAVKLGQLNQDYAEIIEGLEEGDEVVLSAQFLLDSESSRNSDFLRMTPVEREKEQAPASVTVLGEILERYEGERKVHTRHDPVPEWDWPEMMMDFMVAEAVDLDQLVPGTVLHMTIAKRDDGQFEISAVHIMEMHHD